SDGTGGVGTAIYLNSSGNSSVINNSIWGNLGGISAYFANFSNISNNVINANSSYAIFISSGTNYNVLNNTVSCRNFSICWLYGIYATSVSNSFIVNNVLVLNGSQGNFDGIAVSNSNGIKIHNNTINISQAKDNWGIQVSSTNYSNITDNSINVWEWKGTSVTPKGISVSGDYNKILRNNVTVNTSDAVAGTIMIEGKGIEIINNSLQTTAYFGSWSIYPVNSKNLTIIGNKITSITTGGELLDPSSAGIIIAGSSINVTIQNNTFSTPRYGIYAASGLINGVINYNKFSDLLPTTTYYGIYSTSSINLIIANNTFNFSNYSSGNYYGIYSTRGNYTIIDRNSFIGTVKKPVTGISLVTENHTTVSNNTIDINTTSLFVGISLSNSANNSIGFNRISSNGSSQGIYLSGSSNNTIANNTVNIDQVGSGYALVLTAESGSNIIYNNVFNGSTGAVSVSTVNNNTWNISVQSGTNILGGSLIGGNAYLNKITQDYSLTCEDYDGNLLCD
ncbi:MAG: NosD domain-containing protein, partial [archaeon]